MAAAVLVEEELQHSMATSEEDAEFEEDDELAPDVLQEAEAFAANNQLHSGLLEQIEGKLASRQWLSHTYIGCLVLYGLVTIHVLPHVHHCLLGRPDILESC